VSAADAGTAGDPLDHRSAFSQPRFRRYFPSTLMSTLGSWVLRFLFGWVAWEATHSAFWVGTVAALMLAPTFLLSPLFGITADRINPRNGLLVTVSLQGVTAALAALVEVSVGLSLAWLMALALFFGAVTSAHTPIRLAMLPRLVERQALPSAIGYSSIVFNSARIIGPAIGAWLLTLAPVPAVFAVSAVTMAAAALLLTRVRGVCAGSGRDHRASIADLLREGVRYAARHPSIRLVFLVTLASGMLGRTLIELLPAVSGKLLGGDSTTLAMLSAAAGAGSILGGLLVSRQGGRLDVLYRLVLAALTAAALVLLTAAAWGDLVVMAAAVALVAACTTTIGTGCQALTQLMVQEEFRGRVMSLWTVIAMGTPALGAVVVGIVADRASFPAAFAGTAVLALGAALFARQRLNQGAETGGQ
jgi:MFS family permease